MIKNSINWTSLKKKRRGYKDPKNTVQTKPNMEVKSIAKKPWPCSNTWLFLSRHWTVLQWTIREGGDFSPN